MFIMVHMKRRWLILFAVALALLGTLPRLRCLCHNNEVLLITTSVPDCCHSEHAQHCASMKGADFSCFRSSDNQAIGCVSWSSNSFEIIIAVVCLPLAVQLPPTDFMRSIANATRGPPFLPEYLLGLYLLHGVNLS
jgi:hypothetical protein